MYTYQLFRTVKLYQEMGTVLSIQGYHSTTTKKWSFQDQCLIIEALCDNPSFYLNELQHLVHLSSGSLVCIATINNLFAQARIL